MSQIFGKEYNILGLAVQICAAEAFSKIITNVYDNNASRLMHHVRTSAKTCALSPLAMVPML